SEQEFAVSPVENVDESVPIGLQQQFPLAPPICRIRQNKWFRCVPIVKVVRSELVMPPQLSRLRIQSEDTVSVKIRALALVSVGGGERVPNGPVEGLGLHVIGPGQPCRPAPGCYCIADPRL